MLSGRGWSASLLRLGVCRRCKTRAILVGLHYLTHYGVSPRPLLPQDKDSFLEKHRTQKKRFSFSRSPRVFPPLVRVSYHFTSPGDRQVVTPAGIAREIGRAARRRA